MGEPLDIPEIAALFPNIPPEQQAAAEEMHRTMRILCDDAYERGVATGLFAVIDYFHQKGLHNIENMLKTEVGIPTLDRVEQIMRERRG